VLFDLRKPTLGHPPALFENGVRPQYKLMKNKLVWRLSKLPEPSELAKLVELKIITQEEAKSIILKEETDDDRDRKSLESEIKFLREMVEKLSQERSRVVEVIKTIEVEVPVYKKYPWYEPYRIWMYSGTTDSNKLLCSNQSFSDIKTF
jgi:hypothetical protein